ncbi:MAG: sensor histidine kinase [Pseudomonadales bacterium]|nr:sensor histidine kinase [Pseudomonadales bacterium]
MIGLNYINYLRYHETIFKTQTVDFNIFHNLAPTKISSVLLSKDQLALDELLTSNFKRFGIVITDCKLTNKICPDEKVIHSNWSDFRTANYHELQKHEFAVLRDPPPLHVVKKFENYSSKKSVELAKDNHGKVIGRVYFIRTTPPSFIDTQEFWIRNLVTKGEFIGRYTYGANAIFALFMYLVLLVGFRQYKLINKIKESKLQDELKDVELERMKADNSLQVAELERVKAENSLHRVLSFNRTLCHRIDQDFSSVVANQIQKLDSILKDIILRIGAEVKDIAHDMNNASLPYLQEATGNIIQVIKDKNDYLNISDDLIELIEEMQLSIKTIRWVLEDLKNISSLQSEQVDVNSTIRMFASNLPPVLTQLDWLYIDFSHVNESPLYILANSHHITSIVKNTLYNSSAALKSERRKRNKEKKGIDFKGYISVITKLENQNVIITITDNGPGIPEEYIKNLYESHEKVNSTSGESKGNGSTIVTAYLMLHNGKVFKENLSEGGARVSYIFRTITNNEEV